MDGTQERERGALELERLRLEVKHLRQLTTPRVFVNHKETIVARESEPLACSCGACTYRAGYWYVRSVPVIPASGDRSHYPAMACPVCGDLLQPEGKLVRMVPLESAANLAVAVAGYIRPVSEALLRAECDDLAKEPVVNAPSRPRQPIGGNDGENAVEDAEVARLWRHLLGRARELHEERKRKGDPLAPTCSCEECEWRIPPSEYAATPGWVRRGCAQGWISSQGLGALALACPVCGDLLLKGGKVMQMVQRRKAQELASDLYYRRIGLNESMFSGPFGALAAKPIGGNDGENDSR